MKKYLSKKTIWQTLLSVVALGVFVLAGLGSIIFTENPVGVYTDKLSDGRYQVTYRGEDELNKTTGMRDDVGRWQGPVSITTRRTISGSVRFNTEEANFVDGKRHGECRYTDFFDYEFTQCYNMGVLVNCQEKAAHGLAESTSAYQILTDKYPWFLFELRGQGFEEDYIESYMDTLETVMENDTINQYQFIDFYDDALDVMKETRYDTLIVISSQLSAIQGQELLKGVELRLAVLDHYRSEGKSTFDILESKYPGYILYMNDAGQSTEDFEVFCNNVDDSLASYGPLDLEDPFFIDSVDVRLLKAIVAIYTTDEESASATILTMKNATDGNANRNSKTIYQEFKTLLGESLMESSPQRVAAVLLIRLTWKFEEGDILRKTFEEAYNGKKGISVLPTVTTELLSNNAGSGNIVQGYVIDDGGMNVTKRGIAWDTTYNPTLDKQFEASGNGIGVFSIALPGLVEGTVYYARTYATNLEGKTAYGNCVSFTADAPTGIHADKLGANTFSIYPNPASGLTTFSLQLSSPTNISIRIVDMKGQIVYHNSPENLVPGENSLRLDLSELQTGMYTCLLTTNGELKESLKLVIR